MLFMLEYHDPIEPMIHGPPLYPALSIRTRIICKMTARLPYELATSNVRPRAAMKRNMDTPVCEKRMWKPQKIKKREAVGASPAIERGTSEYVYGM